ncbi:MAG: hypothetical protein ACPLXA_02755 [Moorellaceae bacterium]
MKRILAGLFMALLSSLTLLAPAVAEPKFRWADLVTGVDASGNIVTSHLYGYYVGIEGVGEVFIACDPATGKETGEAYIPGAKIGERKVQRLAGYERKEDLDWDHPKQVNPPRVAVMMPNIPTSVEYDLDYYKRTGKLLKKTVNEFKWPMSYSFARMVPGSDPDYWLIVAALENPNPFPVTVNSSLSVKGWRSRSDRALGNMGYSGAITFGPNETKYLLLNRGQKGYFLAEDIWIDWPEPGYSEAGYSFRVLSVDDPEYPEILISDNGRQGYFKPYVRWDNTDPTVLPLIPMRLAYTFSCYGDDIRGGYDPQKGRGWPEVYGRAEYDPETKNWSVSVSYNAEKPRNWSNEKWQAYIAAVKNNATQALAALFAKWYPKIPFWDAWWDEPYLYADADTGYYSEGSSFPTTPKLKVRFEFLEPVPPSTLPPGVSEPNWWANVRYGGWRYVDDGGPRCSGVYLPAPVLTGFGYDKAYPIWEGNYREYSVKDDDVTVPAGTAVYIRHTDPRYYDTDWMDIIPVVEAKPMFVEKYTFVATEGNFGYLKKDTVPGYLLAVDVKDRPTLNVATQPLEVRARCGRAVRSLGTYKEVWREWSWTPSSGWQYLGETEKTPSSLSDSVATWELHIKYNHIVSGKNPEEFTVSFKNSSGGTPSLYWPGASTLQSEIEAMADQVTKSGKSYARVDYVNVESTIALPGVPSLGPEETKWLVSYEREAGARFYKTPKKSESWNAFQDRVLGEIASKILQPIFGQEEAVFDGGGKFVMTPTFKTGEGGIVCGAQKYLVHQRYKWDSEDDDYVWDDLRDDVIGFPGAGITLCSYISPNTSPTEGLVVQGGDEYLGTLLSQRWNEIPFHYDVSNTQRQWRFYYNGQVYPPPYPED